MGEISYVKRYTSSFSKKVYAVAYEDRGTVIGRRDLRLAGLLPRRVSRSGKRTNPVVAHIRSNLAVLRDLEAGDHPSEFVADCNFDG
jgi:hypothetical protein